METLFSYQPGFWDALHEFAGNEGVSWRYLPKRWEHIRLCGPASAEDHSFLVLDNGKAVACCELSVEQTSDGGYEFASRGGCNLGPVALGSLTARQQEAYLDHCFRQIDSLAERMGPSRCLLELDPTAVSSKQDLLPRHGYLVFPAHTAIIDLRQDKKTLHSALRGSFKPLINKALKTYEIRIFDYRKHRRKDFDAYVEMHHKAAGRVTRPLRTFDLQYDKIATDNAILMGVAYEGVLRAFSYHIHNGGHACYGSAADDKGFTHQVPLSHAMIWSAIAYYKDRGFTTFELGEQAYGPQLFSSPSRKEINISFFKRGFGGGIVPIHRGVKYYAPSAMQRDLSNAVRDLVQTSFPESVGKLRTD
jgi:hypothetical protein